MGGIARDECRHFDDLNDARYRITPTNESVVPWNLRLLCVRIQAGGDNPQGLFQYYVLAREARSSIQSEKMFLTRLLGDRRLSKEILEEEEEDTKRQKIEELTKRHPSIPLSKEEFEVLEKKIDQSKYRLATWRIRLRNLGLFIATMLLGMRDTKSAISLLMSIYNSCEKRANKEDDDEEEKDEKPEDSILKEEEKLANGGFDNHYESKEEFEKFKDRVAFTLAMIYLQTGDTISSRLWFSKLSDTASSDMGKSICFIADADWDAAEQSLTRQLDSLSVNDGESEEQDGKAMLSPIAVAISNNLSVTQVHKCKIEEAVSLLETMILSNKVKTLTVLNNLSIIYDLQQEASKTIKTEKKMQVFKVLEEQGFVYSNSLGPSTMA